jgi:hypothetical protein
MAGTQSGGTLIEGLGRARGGTINYREAFIELLHIEIRLFRDDLQIEGI